MIDKLKAYGWMVLAILFGSLLLVQTYRLHGAQMGELKAVTTQATERATGAANVVAATAEVRSTEQGLNAAAAYTRQETNYAVLALNTQRDTLLKRVQRAESNAATASLVSRTTAAAGDGQAAPGDPGAELLGTYGAADVEEGARAETIRLHLKACYRDYEAARQALK